MPALLTSRSIRWYLAIVSATPFSTAASSATFMATAKASAPAPLISRAAASAASRLRSAITGMPPSAAKRSAISLPIPLAAPVMMPTFPSKWDITGSFQSGSRIFQIVEDNLAQAERQIGDIMAGADHFAHRQPRHVAHRMLEQLDRRRAGPGALNRHVLEVIAHQLADARRAIDVRDDLDHERWPGEGLLQRRRVDLAMLVAHGRADAQHRAVMQGANHGLAFMRDLRAGELLRKPPDFAPAGDRRVVVEIHRVNVAAFLHRAVLGFEPHRDHLAGFGIIAKAGRIGHADKFIGDGVA